MLRLKLPALLIVLAIVPPVLAVGWLALAKNRYRQQMIKEIEWDADPIPFGTHGPR